MMDSFNKENIIISQDDISTPLRHKSSRHTVNSSPLRNRSVNGPQQQLFTPAQKESFILADSSDLDLFEYQKLERQFANVILAKKSLEAENQNLEMEMLLREKELLAKSTKLNELVIENKNLEKRLQNEQKQNEMNHNNWMTLKRQYENKISNLTKNLQKDRSFVHQTIQDPTANQTNVNILTKRLKSVQSELELEKNSKMLIIDEFEILKQNFLNLELNYNLLQNEYDSLRKENSIDVVNPADCSFESESSYGGGAVEHVYGNEEIHVRKQREQIAESSDNDSDDDGFGGNPAPPTLADELEEKYHQNQELIKLNFQIKSLNLQNEKLYSYIGYLLQNSMNDKEYSDEKLIKLAKDKLTNNRVLRSVSSSAKLHAVHRSDSNSLYYSDHATDEEMSIFFKDCYGSNLNKKIYNIKSTANLKKLHIKSNSSCSFDRDTIEEEEDEEEDGDEEDEDHGHIDEHKKLKMSILNDLLIGNKIILHKLNINDVLFHGILRFITQQNIDPQDQINEYELD